MLLCAAVVGSAEPIRLHPDNPHYYLFHGKPTILITSAEHYGAVMNRAFDYVAYLDTLKAYGLNYTRIYPAAFVEPVGAFLPDNTLAPQPGNLIQPWARSQTPGYRGGGDRFDLDRWDPEYFGRLKDFLAQADARGIVVEICFFNAQNKGSWPVSPLSWRNNVQGEGRVSRNDVQSLKHPELVRRQEQFVRKIVQEVNSFDNVILEICDEPLSYGTSRKLAGPWIAHLVETIKQTESTLPKKHLLGQQVQGRIGGPIDFSANPDVPLIITQYVWLTPDLQLGGVKAIEELYGRNKPIELNETGYYPLPSWYEGDKAGAARVEAWEFITAGGASFNNLNGVYSVRDPGGKAPENEPVLKTMQCLQQFIGSFDFLKMRPDRSFVVSGLSAGTFYRGISEPGEQYALYHHHSELKPYVYEVVPGAYREKLTLNLPAGSYRAEWVDPTAGGVIAAESLTHPGGQCTLITPEHAIDLALRIKRIPSLDPLALKISPNGHYFLQDGKPFFWMGDTAWTLMSRYTPEEVEAYLEKRRQQGFNIFNVMLLFDGGPGITTPMTDFNGELPFVKMDPAHPNEAYFRNLDRTLAVARAKGLTLVLLPCGGSGGSFVDIKKVITAQNARAYGRWLGRRYKNTPNLVWGNGYDMPPWQYEDVAREFAAGLMEGDGGTHLITYHPAGGPWSSDFFHHESWLTFNEIQTWSDMARIYPMVYADFLRSPAKPVVHAEGAYEAGSEYPNRPITPLKVRQQAYWSYLAGGFHTYGHNDMWRKNPTWRASLDAPGALHMTVLKQVFTSIEWWRHIPDQSVFVSGASGGETQNAASRSAGGDCILVYLSTPATVTLDLAKITAASRVRATWVHTETGALTSAGEFPNHGAQAFQTPASWSDAVLILRAVR